MAKIRIRLWEDKRNGTAEHPLYLVIRHGNHRATMATGISIHARDWNESREEVRKSHVDRYKINRRLEELRTLGQSVITDLVTQGNEPAPKLVKDQLEQELGRRQVEDEVDDFLAYCDELLRDYQARGKISTWKAYQTAVRKLRDFVLQQHGWTALPFDKITPELLRRFHAHLSGPPPKGLGNGVNTINKNMKSLKTMLRQARKEGRIPITHQPFATIKLKRERAIKEKISTEDVRRIARLPLAEGSLLGIIRDAWMFSFYAGGMRFGDVATMRRRHLRVSREDGTEVVRSLYRMGKTEGIHGVLLVEKAVAILDRYGWREKTPGELLFPLLIGYDLSTPLARHNAIATRNALANKYLKKLQKKAGITTNLTFHLSRHSLAGYLLEQGYDVYTIKEVLGHETVKITEDYLRGFKGSGPDEAMRSIQL